MDFVAWLRVQVHGGEVDITLEHKTVKRWCDVQTETVRPRGLVAGPSRFEGKLKMCTAPCTASDVLSISHAVGTQL
jgi:hypothetical protein